MTTMYSLYKVNEKVRMSYTIRIYNSSCAESFPMVETFSQIWNFWFWEITLRTELNEEHEVYVDNSMTVQKREILTYEEALKKNLTSEDPTKMSVMGLNGFPIVNGVLMKNKEDYFGFSTSHSSLLNVLDKSQFEVMIIRGAEHDDGSGIMDVFREWNIAALSTVFFHASSVDDYLRKQTYATHTLNKKFHLTFNSSWSKDTDTELNLNTYNPLGEVKGLSAVPGEIDLINVEFDPEREVVSFWMRNTMPYSVLLHSLFNSGKFVTFRESLNAPQRHTFKADPHKKAIEGLRMPYSDIIIEKIEEIEPKVYVNEP
jgi:hypothetical protein